MEKSSYKWSPLQKLIAVFYAVMLFSSSFFSFVYITNLVYKDTQYIDAHTVLRRSYRIYLNEIDEYSTELTKVIQLTISNKLSELQELMPDSNNTQRTQEELENERINAENTYLSRLAEEETAQAEFETARETYITPMSERWRSSSTYAKEKDTYDNARKKLEAAKKTSASAKAVLDQIEQDLENYKPSEGTIVHELLLESLKTEPDQEILNSRMTDLNDLVLQSDEEDINSSRFVNIVSKTQELTIAVENYQTLKQIQSQPESNKDITDLKNDLSDTDITIPVPSSEEFENDKAAWEAYWKERFTVLEELISSVPTVSNSTFLNLEGADQIINVQLLLQFDAQKIATEISKISRSNLENINAIERAIHLLFQNDFPALAIFSAIFALFLDLSSLLAGLFVYLISESKKEDPWL